MCQKGLLPTSKWQHSTPHKGGNAATADGKSTGCWCCGNSGCGGTEEQQGGTGGGRCSKSVSEAPGCSWEVFAGRPWEFFQVSFRGLHVAFGKFSKTVSEPPGFCARGSQNLSPRPSRVAPGGSQNLGCSAGNFCGAVTGDSSSLFWKPAGGLRETFRNCLSSARVAAGGSHNLPSRQTEWRSEVSNIYLGHLCIVHDQIKKGSGDPGVVAGGSQNLSQRSLGFSRNFKKKYLKAPKRSCGRFSNLFQKFWGAGRRKFSKKSLKSPGCLGQEVLQVHFGSPRRSAGIFQKNLKTTLNV